MKWLRAALTRFAGLWRGSQRDEEVAAELEAHLQLHIDDNVKAGMMPEEARRQAILKLGGVEATKQFCRERNTLPFFEHLLQDAHYAVRQLRKNPVFAGTAIFVLAVGMSASIAIFTFVDSALVKPLPYLNPGHLLGVFESLPTCPLCNLSYPDYLDWKRRNTVFSSLDIYTSGGFALRTKTGVEPARAGRVSDGFFHTLGVTPILGRDFRPGEDLPSAQRTLLLSYRAWQKRYGGKRDVLGATVTLNDKPYTVIGVLPAEFHFAPIEPADYWTAFHAESECDLRRSCHGLYGVGRLKDGISEGTARANVVSIAKQLEKEYPENQGQGGAVSPLSEVIVGFIRPILLVLLGGSALLLLIAGVNVASLLLVRTESRKREMAVRTALGAGRARIHRQFLTEGLVLAFAGSALGTLAGFWVLQLLAGLLSEDMLGRMPYLQGLHFNAHTWLFAAGIALLTAALFSLTPALHFATQNKSAALREGSRGASGSAWRRLGSKLVVLELATAMVLLVGAGLLSKSLYLMLHVDIGMQPDHLATLSVGAPTYPKEAQQVQLVRQVASRLAALPGVKTVGVSTDLPINGWGDTTWFRIVGHPWHGEHNDTPEREISASYFETIGAKLLRGRGFREDEDSSKPLVAIVNRSFQQKYFPNEDPTGKQLASLGDKPRIREIVGVVEDIKEGPLNTANRPVLYQPFGQDPSYYFNVVVRTSQAEQSLLPAMSATIRQLDPDLVPFGGKTMRLQMEASTYLPRTAAWLVGGFSGVALLLGVVGLYGVVAYSVSQRTREIGVRMALGAQRRTVYELILKEAGWLTLAGIVTGLLGAVAAAQLMSSLLFGVKAWDVITLVGVALLLGCAALVASFFPARRAAGVNPLDALRVE
jgi:predicted permease